MKLRFCGHAALLIGTLLGGPLAAAPAGAQQTAAMQEDTAGNNTVTLSLQNVPVQAALRTLFSRAGVSSYVIDPDVQGYANVQVSDVPFTLALRQLLRSVQSPLDFTATGGTYHITLKQVAPSAQADAPSAEIGTHPTRVALNDSGDGGARGVNAAGQPLRFYPIPINKYDAYYIAALLGAQGVVKVDVNGVIPSAFGTASGGQGGGQAGGQGGFGTGQNGFGGGQGGFGGGQGSGYGGGQGGGRRGGRGYGGG